MAVLGSGTDHTVVALGDDLVARIPHQVDAETEQRTRREVRVLDLVGPAVPVPVPEVVAADPATGLVVLTRLEGTSLLAEPCPQPEHLAGQLADLLVALAALGGDQLAAEVGADDAPLEQYLEEAWGHLDAVAALLPTATQPLVEARLGAPLPPGPTRSSLCHNDLGAEHLLAGGDRRQLTGVIDWSDAAVSDPARDLARIYRDLGPQVASAVLARVGDGDDEATWARTRFLAACALLEDLAYGHETGRPRYRDEALRNLERTFAW
jgi:aminoglycoside phosphotransferase (APT) family kinase protein